MNVNNIKVGDTIRYCLKENTPRKGTNVVISIYKNGNEPVFEVENCDGLVFQDEIQEVIPQRR